MLETACFYMQLKLAVLFVSLLSAILDLTHGLASSWILEQQIPLVFKMNNNNLLNLALNVE